LRIEVRIAENGAASTQTFSLVSGADDDAAYREIGSEAFRKGG